MNSASTTVIFLLVIAALGPLSPALHGQTKNEEAEYLAAPTADVIPADLLAPAVRQAVANGVATLVARMTAEGNEHGLVFPPAQTLKVVGEIEVSARRVQVEHPIYEHEYAEVERIVPEMQSGQPTGRFTKQKTRVIVKSRQVGKKVVEQLIRLALESRALRPTADIAPPAF